MGSVHRPSRPGRRQSLSVSIQPDIESGKELSKALVDGTLSQESESALICMNELREGLLRQPIPHEVHQAITHGNLSPGLRNLLLVQLYRGKGVAVKLPSPVKSRNNWSTIFSNNRWPSQHASQSFIEEQEVLGPVITPPNPSNNTSPNRKIFNSDMAQDYESPRASMNINCGYSSSISKAPFGASSSVPAKLAPSPGPAEDMGKAIKQPSDKFRDKTEPGSITGILRGSGAGRNLKRKRVESVGLNATESFQSHLFSSNLMDFAQPIMSSKPGNTTSAIPSLKQFAQNSISHFLSSKPRNISGPALQETQSVQDTNSAAASQANAKGNELSQPLGGRQGSGAGSLSLRMAQNIKNSDLSSDLSLSEDPVKQATDNDDKSVNAEQDDNDETDEDEVDLDIDISDTHPTVSENGLTASGGRPYNIWRLANGQEIATRGAILPTEYQLYFDVDRPWVCPVRSCRIVFKTLDSLGGHFNAKHRGATLNDNRDGTLSVTGYQRGTGRLPAIVVSKKALDASEPPMQDPKQSDNQKSNNNNTSPAKRDSEGMVKYITMSAKSSSKKNAAISASTPRSDLAAANVAMDDNAQWTWKNIVHKHLRSTPISPIPKKGYVCDLLPLNRNQKCCDLTKWHQDTYPELLKTHIPIDDSPIPIADLQNSIAQPDSLTVRRSERKLLKLEDTSPATKLTAVTLQDEVSNDKNTPTRQLRDARNTGTLDLAPAIWEIAPGRIRTDPANGAENIAFSAAYLTHVEEVNIGPDIGFHVLALKSGTLILPT
ncbi:hypothetical protein TruAng_004097 [Truncatella angustata]|nr:hypothetical protein TruAng_004097 [Truncatella angustata]